MQPQPPRLALQVLVVLADVVVERSRCGRAVSHAGIPSGDGEWASQAPHYSSTLVDDHPGTC